MLCIEKMSTYLCLPQNSGGHRQGRYGDPMNECAIVQSVGVTLVNICKLTIVPLEMRLFKATRILTYFFPGTGRSRGRCPRGTFSSPEHTQFSTHMLKKRRVCSVPVLLGERIPRSDRGAVEKEA